MNWNYVLYWLSIFYVGLKLIEQKTCRILTTFSDLKSPKLVFPTNQNFGHFKGPVDMSDMGPVDWPTWFKIWKRNCYIFNA